MKRQYLSAAIRPDIRNEDLHCRNGGGVTANRARGKIVQCRKRGATPAAGCHTNVTAGRQE
jgi:hypothetical protein